MIPMYSYKRNLIAETNGSFHCYLSIICISDPKIMKLIKSVSDVMIDFRIELMMNLCLSHEPIDD